MTLLDLSLADLVRNHGTEAARRAHLAAADAVEQIGAFIEQHGIDCDWRHGGLMVVATNATQEVKVQRDLEAAEAIGVDDHVPLTGAEARERVSSPLYRCGYHEAHAAVVNPLKLAFALAVEAERRGVTVVERSGMTGLEHDSHGARIATSKGTVRADQVVVATNAWAGERPEFRPSVTPLYTYILMSEPLNDAQWERIGWADHCGVEDKRGFVHYYRRTVDGRILWGGADGVVYPNGSIRPSHDTHDGVARRLDGTFRATFPQLADVRFTHHWGGPVGLTNRFLPTFGTLGGGRVHYGLGYCGHGVGPSHLGGQILRDKVLGVHSELLSLCFVDTDQGAMPPYPVRWAGSAAMRTAITHHDDRAQRHPDDVLGPPCIMKVLG
jgi:glycine/D-amino acid oxidase-like deaminating enzyme